MLFNSFVFAGIFLPLCLLLFWLAPGDRAKRTILLIGSLVFYGYWHPPYLILLIGLVAIAWGCALWAERTESRWPVVTACVLLLGTLAYYKYAGFLLQVAGDLGLANGNTALKIALPLGISFIVFQALGYVIDVHRKEFRAERSFAVTLLFKAFFPQLIAGPICRASELIPQLKSTFRFSLANLLNGIGIFAVGLFLKMVFADNLASQVDVLFAPDRELSRLESIGATLGFGAQIFADFWGYSTMAVGLALMFGVTIPVNFRLPYIATSLRDFWRRWHITLSQWLRDYLYKSLGGSWHGQVRTIFALLATMLLGGLWHGANYTFIVWGAIHGLALVAEHLLGRKPSSNPDRSGVVSLLTAATGWLYTFSVVMLAWIFFRATSLEHAMSVIHSILTAPMGDMTPALWRIAVFGGILALVQAPLYMLLERMRSGTFAMHLVSPLATVFCLSAIVLGAAEAVKFIYFEF